MRVKNLWRLLLPCGHRLSIETLSHQTLAIDASIWLTQISKACRDPETGRLLPNRPHVRIFLLRLMRLLYHRIRPVVVFDGIMPEVKRRELQRRRDRREKLWKGESGGSGDADLALKRTAKKILVQQLKDWREKNKKNKKDDASKGDQNDNMQQGSPASKERSAASKNNGGAFASGFTIGDEDINDKEDAKLPSILNDVGLDADNAKLGTENKRGSNNEDAISINSSEDDLAKPAAKATEANNDDDTIDDANDSDNDWEMSIAIQSSISDSIKQQQKQQQQQQQQQQRIEYQDLTQQPNETIASLPSETRSQWMESQYRAQRIQSRKECIGAAANPEDYSSTQLRNFLKGSRLNKKMGDIGKLAGQLLEEGANNNFVNVEEDNDDDNGQRRVLRRPKNKDGDGDNSDDELFDQNNEPTTAKVSMKVLFGEDDDESGDDHEMEECGGGFLLPNSVDETKQQQQAEKAAAAASNEIVIDDSSDESVISVTGTTQAVAESSDNTTNTSNRNDEVKKSSSPPKGVSSRLMALSSADQEWAEWGEGENDTQDKPTIEESASLKLAAKSNTADTPSFESDSDDEPTFFSLIQGQSKPAAKARLVASSNKPASQTTGCPVKDDSDDNDDNDDVDWEDGGQVDQNDDQVDEKTSLYEVDSQHVNNEDEDGNDDNIDWEDGGEDDQADHEVNDLDGMSKERARASNGDHLTTRHILQPRLDGHVNNDDGVVLDEDAVEESSGAPKSHRDSVDTEKEVINVDDVQPSSTIQSEHSCNPFEIDNFSSNDATTAALRHAQETASKLTDWAGRALERAIAAHIEEKGGSPTKDTMTEDSPMVDLTVDEEEDEEDEEEEAKENEEERNSSDLEEEQYNDPAATQNAKDGLQPVTHKTVDLFDTSLEGLNQVHNDILEEERLMERDMSTITDEMKMDILNLLQLTGIPWIESPSEAEAQCAALEELGLVDGIVTEDSDVFVFGGRKIYKNFFNEQKFVEAYYAKDIKKDLALGRNQLVALAMLLGGDYTDGVKGVGIVNGMEILQSFVVEDGKDGIRDGLQKFREWLDGIDDPLADDDNESATYLSKVKLFHKKHQSARTRWIAPEDFPSRQIIEAYMKPAVDSCTANFSWGKPDIDGLRQFCADSIGWDAAETDRVVQPVLEILESGSKQTRIESYFMKYEDGIKFAEVKSKRLKAVLDEIQTEDDIEGSNKKMRTD